MINLSNNIRDQAYDSLNNIKNAIKNNKDIIPIDAKFYFTKGSPGNTKGYFLRDINLENDVKNWLKSRISFEKIMDRYKKYYPEMSSLEWPNQYATRFINIAGMGADCSNIFMFFPEVLGLNTGIPEDYFGFEFVDVWVSIYDEIIFPCVRKVFDEESQIKLFSTLRPTLEKTIYLASIFHEIGHRCGYWRVAPVIDPRIKINKFNTDVLGELATESMILNFLVEFPEVLYHIFLNRIFWFGRFGFSEDSVHGKTNEDNDTWIGSYLWNEYIKKGVLTQNFDKKWNINFTKLENFFTEILLDIDKLGADVINSGSKQNNIINTWMHNKVQRINGKYAFPKKLQEFLAKCHRISDRPSFKY